MTFEDGSRFLQATTSGIDGNFAFGYQAGQNLLWAGALAAGAVEKAACRKLQAAPLLLAPAPAFAALLAARHARLSMLMDGKKCVFLACTLQARRKQATAATDCCFVAQCPV